MGITTRSMAKQVNYEKDYALQTDAFKTSANNMNDKSTLELRWHRKKWPKSAKLRRISRWPIYKSRKSLFRKGSGISIVVTISHMLDTYLYDNMKSMWQRLIKEHTVPLDLEIAKTIKMYHLRSTSGHRLYLETLSRYSRFVSKLSTADYLKYLSQAI